MTLPVEEPDGKDCGGKLAMEEDEVALETNLDRLQGVPTLRRNAYARKTPTKTPSKCYNALWHKNTRNPGACAYNYNKLLTALVNLVLLVVNSVKLHLTAYKITYSTVKTRV